MASPIALPTASRSHSPVATNDARVAFGRAIEIEGPCTDDARAALAGATPFRG